MARGRSGGAGAAPIQLGLLVLLAVVFGLVLLRGHGGGADFGALPPPPAEHTAPSLALDIDVYLDGSGSIQHFLQRPPATAGDAVTPPNYVEELLDKAETTLHNAPADSAGAGWGDVALRFYRFGAGTRPTPIPGSGGLQRMSQDPGAFHEADTRIETPVEHTVPSSTGEPRAELKIILTDLYQSGGQLEKPADALADRYLRSDTGAVGVVAVRSAFTGPVEDLPGTPRGGSLAGAADSMPFYLLFAGEAPDVRHAMEVLIAGTGLRDAFARHLAAQWLFTRAPLGRGTGAMRFTGASYSLVSRDTAGTPVAHISLGKGTLEARWSDPRLLAADAEPVGAPPHLESAALRVGPGHSWVPAPEASAAARPCSGGGEALCMALDRGGLQTGRTYLFQFPLMSGAPADTLQPGSAALRAWDIELPDAERISTEAHPQFPPVAGVRVGERPGLTPDLSKFLLALAGGMFRTPVRQTTYDLYVTAN